MAADWQYSDNAIAATTSVAVGVSLGLKASYILITCASTTTGVYVEFSATNATTSASYLVSAAGTLELDDIPASSFSVLGATAPATVKVLALGKAISS